ncbi:MAG: hypothetical protein ACLFPF_09425 [Halanaerobiales bacterium]
MDESLINSRKKFFNFLINCANQANLVGLNDSNPVQISSLFVFVKPYILKKFDVDEGLDIEINMDENGTIWVDDEAFEPIEVNPGVSIFGIMKNDEV